MSEKTDKNNETDKTKKLDLIVIAGPTATGKTAAAVALAKQINGEIISADSMQIYKYMDIGTAKPSPEETGGIRHFLIDELYPDEPYSVADFKKKADDAVRDISSRGKTPIICGGTGFYINALLKGTVFTDTEVDEQYRASLWAFAQNEGAEVLHKKLEEIDPEAAKSIHPNNIKRVIRALEYFKQTGEQISVHNKRENERKTQINSKIFIFNMDRNLLYDTINIRVDRMLKNGLFQEVRNLLEMGYSENLTSMKGLGYKEIIPAIKGELTPSEAVELLKKNTRHFAKRQLTWFSGQCDGEYVNASKLSDKGLLCEYLCQRLYEIYIIEGNGEN